MSTAGKVLVVLVLLFIPVWIVLVSAVSRLNTVWGQELDKQQKLVLKLEQDVATHERALADLKDKITLEQTAVAETATVLRSKVASVERAKAETIQIQTALKVQNEILAAALARAETAREQRKDEKQKETQAKAEAEMAVNDLKAENAELMSQLTQLRDEFRSLLESNKTLVDRMLKSGARRTARPAAFAR